MTNEDVLTKIETKSALTLIITKKVLKFLGGKKAWRIRYSQDILNASEAERSSA